jgi:chemotaxis protein MotB
MKTVRMLALIGGLGCVWVTTAGCVSRDEYLREKFGRRKAVERAEALERDLADERNRVLAMETEREGLHRELSSKTALCETLEAENKRLDGFSKSLQAQMDDILAKGVGDIEVVEIKLPAELDRALKELAAQYPDTIEYDPAIGAVRWKSDLTFALGSDVVRNSAKESLKAFADIVNSQASALFDVVVVGHTDNVRITPATAKKHPTNWHLSVHRAVSVLSTLHNYGVDFSRLACMGYGEFRPREPNPPRGGNEANRRVEIYLVSTTDKTPGLETAHKAATPRPVVAKSDFEE